MRGKIWIREVGEVLGNKGLGARERVSKRSKGNRGRERRGNYGRGSEESVKNDG